MMLAALCALTFAASAHADPGTVTGPNGLSLSVDDTTPAPGQTIRFAWTYTLQTGEGGGAEILQGFGGSSASPAENLDDLTFVSCDGLRKCSYTPSATNPDAFFSVNSGDNVGDVITGTGALTGPAVLTITP
jgi:hypothetical protein